MEKRRIHVRSRPEKQQARPDQFYYHLRFDLIMAVNLVWYVSHQANHFCYQFRTHYKMVADLVLKVNFLAKVIQDFKCSEYIPWNLNKETMWIVPEYSLHPFDFSPSIYFFKGISSPNSFFGKRESLKWTAKRIWNKIKGFEHSPGGQFWFIRATTVKYVDVHLIIFGKTKYY